MPAARATLDRYVAERCRRDPCPDGLDTLVAAVADACRAAARLVARAALGTGRDAAPGLDARVTECFLAGPGHLAGLVLPHRDTLPHRDVPATPPRGRFLLALDPLHGSSHLDVNGTAGSIFSLVRASSPSDVPVPGAEQVCAGYAMYGPTTKLVLTVGDGVHVFTLDRDTDEFVRTRTSLRIAPRATEFAVDTANRRFWEPAVRRYVDECVAGRSGPRHRDYTMRWTASLVAEVHRVLVRGGVSLFPRGSRETATGGGPHLLCQADPVAFLVEQAGGAASTGRGRLLDVVPADLNQRAPLIFGAREDVERIERYHRTHNDGPGSGLYGDRGLFRAAAG